MAGSECPGLQFSPQLAQRLALSLLAAQGRRVVTLREVRIALGLTQRAFAAKLLTNLRTYQAYEQGRRRKKLGPPALLMDRARRMLAAKGLPR